MQQSKQLRIILSITMIVGLAVFLSLAVKTKGILVNSNKAPEEELTKIAIITSDVVVDQSWGSLAYKGQMKIEEEFPVSVEFFSEINTEKLMKQTIEDVAEKGAKVVIGHGREFSDVFTSMANNYSDMHFVTIHGNSQHDNQSVYSFDQGDIEYFAALAAALKTKTNKVAILDAIDNRENNLEFEVGLNYYKPDSEYSYHFVGSRDDGEKAVEIMNELVDQGVDVVYSKGNAFNRDVIDLAKSNNIYVIGYLDDQSYMGKENVLTSVLNDVPQIYVSVMRDYFSEEGIPSGKVVLTQDDDVYKLAPLGPMFTVDEEKFLLNELDKFNRGELIFE